MRFFYALASLLVAATVVSIFIVVHRGADSPYGLIGNAVFPVLVVVCFPAWLVFFVPLYCAANPKAFVWRWYGTVAVATVISLMMFWIFSDGDVFNRYGKPVEDRLVCGIPSVVTFIMFLCGWIFKSLEKRKA